MTKEKYFIFFSFLSSIFNRKTSKTVGDEGMTVNEKKEQHDKRGGKTFFIIMNEVRNAMYIFSRPDITHTHAPHTTNTHTQTSTFSEEHNTSVSLSPFNIFTHSFLCLSRSLIYTTLFKNVNFFSSPLAILFPTGTLHFATLFSFIPFRKRKKKGKKENKNRIL